MRDSGNFSMSLGQGFRTKSAVMVVVVLAVAVALLLAPTLAVTASSGHGSNPKTYPIGTVCGDALAGPYSVSSFTGTSSYRGFSVTFAVNDMALSGGASGTVTATSGSVSATGGGYEFVSATFESLTGTYRIVGGSMHVTFEVNGLMLTAPFSMTLGSLTQPVTLSCNTPDMSS